MAKKKLDKTEENLHAVEEALSKTEYFIERNQKYLTIGVIVIVLIVLGVMGYRKFIQQPREKEATNQSFMAQKYFEKDSLRLALDGDGNYLGFLDIIDNYSSTKAGELANYYAGVCYLQLGEYEQAIEYLNDYDGEDEMIAPMARGCVGDAYMELGNIDKAASYYMKAADYTDNDFTTPLHLKKAALAYEKLEKYDDALKNYERIKTDYFKSFEQRDIDKYIARAKKLAKK